MFNYEFDCRHFRGDKPCNFCRGRICKVLIGAEPDCGKYEPLRHRTLVIKLGALGDVVRTTTLLPALHRKFADTAVTWITQPAAMPLLQNDFIYKLLPWNFETALWVQSLHWNVVICLDKEEGPTAFAEKLSADVKYGYGRNSKGLLKPLSGSSEYLFSLGIDDDEKFRRNTLTYPRLIADACELEWGPNFYVLPLKPDEKAWAAKLAEAFESKPAVGLHIGAGEVFAGKCWPLDHFTKLAASIIENGMAPVFLGGKREAAIYESLKTTAPKGSIFLGCEFSLREFIALVSTLDVMVSGDSLAMHIAIGTGVYAIALFGSTTEREIEYYRNGESISAKIACSPCFKRVCPTQEECMRQISVEQVFEAVKRGLKHKGVKRQAPCP